MKKITFLLVTGALLIGLPLAGALYSGNEISDYTEFPPLTMHVEHAPFSWTMFGITSLLILVVILPFDLHAIRYRISSGPSRKADHTSTKFPIWGWFGIALTLTTWFLAWTRLDWFTPFQKYTFSPIWIGYIIAVNALTYKRRGTCLLTNTPIYMLKLSLASAIFWWFFEYLNRFVQNWVYIGISDLSPTQYFIFASLPFATVLPAVMSTAELLESFPQSAAGLQNFIRINTKQRRAAATAILLLASLGLAGIATHPDLLYPLLWIAPLLIITSLQTISGQPTIFSPVRNGNWQRIYIMACAALICGGFWELWNFGSVAKWIYTVPYVNRFKIFEMPLLGFAGYIPFGLECAVIADLLKPAKESDKQ